jgi:predicted DNA-binding transcriptional regulator AlpA
MGCSSTQNHEKDTLENILTEDEILKLTGLKKSQLAELRNREGFPFLKVNRNNRLYLESDVVAWFKGRCTVLNKAL